MEEEGDTDSVISQGTAEGNMKRYGTTGDYYRTSKSGRKFFRVYESHFEAKRDMNWDRLGLGEDATDDQRFRAQDGTTVSFTPEELASQGKRIDEAGRLVSDYKWPTSGRGSKDHAAKMQAMHDSGELKVPDWHSDDSVRKPASQQQYTKPKKEKEQGQLTGLMGTHLHTAPKSTGLGWLDKLYQKDADMRYEKALMKKEVKSDWVLSEEKLVPKVVVLNNETNTSKTMKKSSTSTKVMTPGFSVTNSSSVAVKFAK